MLLEDLINTSKKTALAIQQEILDTPYGERFLKVKLSKMTMGEAFKDSGLINLSASASMLAESMIILDIIDEFDDKRDDFDGSRIAVSEDSEIGPSTRFYSYFGEKRLAGAGLRNRLVERCINKYCRAASNGSWFDTTYIDEFTDPEMSKTAYLPKADRFFRAGETLKAEGLMAGMPVFMYNSNNGGAIYEIMGFSNRRAVTKAINADTDGSARVKGNWLTADVVQFKSVKEAMAHYKAKNVTQLCSIMAEAQEADNLAIILKNLDDGWPSSPYALIDGRWKSPHGSSNTWARVMQAIEV